MTPPDHQTSTPAPPQAATGNQDVHLHVVDLSSLQQIQRFSHDFAHSGRKLHVLINNAATMQDARGETAEGVEMAQVQRGWMVQ